MESDADRLASIKALGGQLISHSGGSFWAIVDRDYVTADNAVETKNTALTARTSDVKDIVKDTVFTIEEQLFRVRRHEPDSSGFTALVLKR